MGLDNPLHIAFLLVVLLMVFGAKRLPEMGKSLGHGLRGFKDAINPDASAPAPALGTATPAEPALAAHAPAVEPGLAVHGPAAEPAPVVAQPRRERAAA